MTLTTCRECGGKVSTETVACPHCGVPDPARSAKEVEGEGKRPQAEVQLDISGQGRRAALLEHEWPGKLLVALLYLAGAGFALAFLVTLVVVASDLEGAEFLAVGAVGVVMVAFPVLLGRGISRFKKWSWWVGVTLYTLGIISAPLMILDPTEDAASRVAATIVLPVQVLFVWYLWQRKADFR